MGIWGTSAMESDGANNWLENAFDMTGLEAHVMETLNRAPEHHWEEIRATAFLVKQLTDADLWPAESSDRVRSLAALRLDQVIHSGAVTNEVLKTAIRSEIVGLSGDQWRGR